ncbi:hypothetical protein ACHAWT_000731, partial [Skeletonema menzelii]
SKNGKGSSGGRWNGGLRPDKWSRPNKKPSKWSSPNSWSGSSSKDYDDDVYDDDDRPGGNRKPLCTLANPVNEQFDYIIRSWRIAYEPSNAGLAVTWEREVVWHANLVMNRFMEIVEDYDDDDLTTDEIFDLGEYEGANHPTTVKFTTDDQQDAICSLTKALVLMMKDSCLYSRWKRTLEINAYYFMDGFIEGASTGNNFNSVKKCVGIKEPKNTSK